MDNNQNTIQYSNETKSSNNNLKIIIGVLVLLLVGIIAFLVYDKVIKNDDNKPKESSIKEDNNKQEEKQTNEWLDSTNKATFKELAQTVINDVRLQLILTNKVDAGDYYFTSEIIEKPVLVSPLGGNINYSDLSNCNDKLNDFICKASETLVCADEVPSFVRVTQENNVYKYSICYTAGIGNNYIDVDLGTEENLLNSANYDMIK